MAYTNNGAYRQLELTEVKTTGGVTATRTYTILTGFWLDGVEFHGLTFFELGRLPEAVYGQRLEAFKAFLRQQGVDPDAAINKPHGLTTDADAPQGLSCPVAAW